MKGSEYLKLLIGMFVTDVDLDQRTDVNNPDYVVGVYNKSDFCRVEAFDKMGRMKLQPLDKNGNPKGEAYWVHHKDYDLQDKMLKSEYLESTV